MKVNPIRYDFCYICTLEAKEFEYTVQYLREIKFHRSRSHYRRRKPVMVYICGECGEENY